MASLIARSIPNTITCCNLLSGCAATLAAINGADYRQALICIIIGAVFDFFDGFAARRLHVTSPIGKELDSLADVITFGLAPAAVVWAYLNENHFPLNVAPFLMVAFSALRLAKFNLDERQTTSFIGLPTPANALFWTSLIVGLDSQETLFSGTNWVLLIGIFISCWLLVAEIPMFALKFKNFNFRDNVVRYLFLFTSLVLILLLGVPGIAAVIVWYVILSLLTQRTQQTKNDES